MGSEILQSIYLSAHWFLTLAALSAGLAGIAVFLRETRIELKRRRPRRISHDFDNILDE